MANASVTAQDIAAMVRAAQAGVESDALAYEDEIAARVAIKKFTATLQNFRVDLVEA